jgi:hypothetical protein
MLKGVAIHVSSYCAVLSKTSYKKKEKGKEGRKEGEGEEEGEEEGERRLAG